MSSLTFNYDNLKQRMEKLRYNQATLAKASNINRSTLNSRLNNNSMFKPNEILKIANVLKLRVDDIGKYFFCLNSKENMTDTRKKI